MLKEVAAMVVRLFGFLAMAVLAATPVFAITLDGRITDWEQAGLLHNDALNDNVLTSAGLDITRYGWTVDNGMFYAVLEVTNAAGVSSDSLYRFFPAAFINVDANNTTGLTKDAATALPEWITGTDISVEWGKDKHEGTGADDCYSFWGAGDYLDNVIDNGVPGGTHANLGNVVELSAPVSLIASTVSSLPDGITALPATEWKVVLGVQGKTSDGTTVAYGYDYAAVPEPSALALTILALLGILAYACRKR
jgi:hypothetical protein